MPSTHVGDLYDDSYFTGGGAGYADYLSEATLIRERGRRYADLLARHMQPGRVLDVGAAAGFFLAGLVDSGWRGCGLEPNPTMARYGQETLGLDIRRLALEDLRDDERYDLLTFVQVGPHLVDPRQALDAAARVTSDGGIWLIETWNCKSLTARAFGKHWHEYSPPSVLHWFSPQRLRRLVESFGLREVARGRPSKRLNAAHAKSLLRHVLGDSAWARPLHALAGLVPDRLNLPYPAEDLFWALYQK